MPWMIPVPYRQVAGLKQAETARLSQGASDEFPQLEEYATYLSAVVNDEENPRVSAIANIFGEALERRVLS